MTALRDPIPLGDHRACIARYLREIVSSAGSVAARIIEERLGERYAGDAVRPSLVLWACTAGNGNVADALPVAAAFDLFDRFLLLHDELGDESAIATVARWGLGQSLNAGDALYALAFHSLASDVSEPSRRLRTARLVGQAILEAIGKSGDNIARGAVLTAAALEAGAVIAGSPDSIARAYAEAGRLLSEAAVCSDPSFAQRASRRAVAALRRHASPDDVAAFEEVACYVARQAG